MRLAFFSVFLALALTAFFVVAQSEDPSASGTQFERSLEAGTPTSEGTMLTERDLLEARQATNTTTSSAPQSTATGSAPLGGNATITESSCSYTNHLSVNQQASWGSGIVTTCCGFARGTECWYRRQDSVSPEDECMIPNCDDLLSEDKSRMESFVPLTSTNGSGKYGNIFLSLGQLSAASIALPAFWLSITIALLSILGPSFF